MESSNLVPDLYRRFGRGLFAYARSLTGRQDQAEDLVQETFLRVLQSGRGAARPEFLYGILRNLGLDLVRKSAVRGKHKPLVARELAAKVSASGSAAEALTASALAELQDLPLVQREVVVLKVLGELTFDQIGEILRVSPATAASRYRYALEKLSARLSAHQEAR